MRRRPEPRGEEPRGEVGRGRASFMSTPWEALRYVTQGDKRGYYKHMKLSRTTFILIVVLQLRRLDWATWVLETCAALV